RAPCVRLRLADLKIILPLEELHQSLFRKPLSPGRRGGFPEKFKPPHPRPLSPGGREGNFCIRLSVSATSCGRAGSFPTWTCCLVKGSRPVLSIYVTMSRVGCM